MQAADGGMVLSAPAQQRSLARLDNFRHRCRPALLGCCVFLRPAGLCSMWVFTICSCLQTGAPPSLPRPAVADGTLDAAASSDRSWAPSTDH